MWNVARVENHRRLGTFLNSIERLYGIDVDYGRCSRPGDDLALFVE